MDRRRTPIVPPHADHRSIARILILSFTALIWIALPGLRPLGRAQDPSPQACPPCPDDGNPCTVEYCIGDSCVHDPGPANHFICDDGNHCTLNDTCEAGTCFPGTILLSCNDNNSCTDDRCEPATGCVFTPRDRFCSDGNPCTAGDWCVAGVCTPSRPATCDDGNACTTDSCIPATGCGHAASGGVCDDGSACTGGDYCDAGVCTGLTACPCPDGDQDGYADCRVIGCDPTGIDCGDCNDADPDVSPVAAETCNQRDDDCDGVSDEGSIRQMVLLRKITDPDGHDGDRFGASLATAGDVDGDGVGDLAVGAPGTDGVAGVDTGAVVLFSGRDLTVRCRATDAAGSANARLGSAVAGLGDVTGDHVPDFAAGAPGQNRVAVFSGADCAPLFVCGDSQTITTGSPQTGFQQSEAIVALGATLAAPGDVNHDDIPDLAAGDPNSSLGSPFIAPFFNAGSVSILSGASCHRLGRAAGQGASDENFFGASIAVLPDMTGDGINDLAVGELLSFQGSGGAVHLVSGASGAKVRLYKDPAGAYRDHLGSSVAPLRDPAGAVLRFIVAGAELDDTAAGVDAGSVAVFDPAGPFVRACLDPEGAPGDHLGAGLAEIADLDADGTPEFAASAPFHDTALGADAGSVVVFSGASCNLVARLDDPIGQPGSRLGERALAALSDLDGDGTTDLGVGAARDSADGPERGSVLLFVVQSECGAAGPPIAEASAPATAECDRPGGAVVTLDGSTSHGQGLPSGGGLSALEWYEDYGLGTQVFLGSGAVVEVTLPLGSHVITLLVTGTAGGTDTDTITIAVQDTRAPSIAIFADPLVLWPPNHGTIQVTVGWTVSDACDPSPVVALVSAASSEPDDAPGPCDGATVGDIAGAEIGTADDTLLLRAERDGCGGGRVYTLTYSAADASGNDAFGLGVVSVPLNQGSAGSIALSTGRNGP